MTSPITTIQVRCPKCAHTYSTQYRASMNLQLDDFDEEYIERMSTATCPQCGHKIRLSALVVQPDGAFEVR